MWTYRKAVAFFGRLVIPAALIGGAAWTYRTVRDELKGDPLAAFRGPRRLALPTDIGVALDKVRLRRYDGKVVRAELQAARLTIARDQQTFNLSGIRDGVYRGPIGKVKRAEVRFAANQGEYNTAFQRLHLRGNVAARGAKFALTTRDLTFDGRKQTARLAQGVAGTAYGGKVDVGALSYDLAKGNFVAARGSWEGRLPAEMFGEVGLGQGDLGTATTWKILANKGVRGQGNTVTYRDLTITDGEVTVITPQGSLDRATDTLVATGGIQYYSARANLVAQKVTIRHREKRAIFEGDVRMLVKPKSEERKGPVIEPIPAFTPTPPEKVVAGKPSPVKEGDMLRSGKTIRDYPLVMVAAKMDTVYAKGRRIATISGGSPQARQELGNGQWRQVWTYAARYDAENEVLRLTSAPGRSDARMKNSLGDDLEATWFELSTKEDDDEYTGENIRGSVVSTEEETKERPPAKATPPPGKKGG